MAPTFGGISVSEDDVVATVLSRLEGLGLEYMIVGSYASNAYGRPRGSFDADVVARVVAGDAQRIFDAFKDDFAVEEQALARDLAAGRMFNLIPFSGMFKVDVIPVRQTEFARTEFARRRRVQAIGRSVWMASPEDTILFKLSWFQQGDGVSARQVEDARDVYHAQKGDLDEAYLDRWAAELGVMPELTRIRQADQASR